MKILYHIQPLPTYVMDPTTYDMSRIRNALQRYHLSCSDENLLIIREAIRPLPSDDDELLDRASEYVFVNWAVAQDKLEPVLRELRQRYKSYSDDPALMPSTLKKLRWTERQILAVTRGLSEHPEWWDIVCHCDSCVSDAQ